MNQPPVRYISAGTAPQAAPMARTPDVSSGLVKVGHALESMGEKGLQIIAQKRRVQESGEIQAFMANLDAEAARFSTELARRSDTDQWADDWQQRLSDIRDRAGALNLSPEARARLENQLGEYATRSAVRFETEAASKDLALSRARTNQSLEYAAGRGDADAYARALDEAAASGTLTPAEIEKARMEGGRLMAAADLDRRIREDPAGTLEELDAPDAIDRFPGTTLEIIDSARARARSEKRRQEMDGADAAVESILAGDVTTSEEIDSRFPGMSLASREKLKGLLAQRANDAARAAAADPTYQNEVFGQVGAMLRDWTPETDGMDATLIEMRTLLDPLPSSPLKDAYLDRMTELVSGAKSDARAKVRSSASAAQTALDEHFKTAEAKLPQAENLTLRDALATGILKDPGQLQIFGFSESQAKDIAKVAEEDGDAAAQLRFKELIPQRERGTADASEMQTAIFDAIRLENSTVQWKTGAAIQAAEEARAEHDRQYGEAKRKLSEWLADHPDASANDIEAKVISITGEGIRATLRKSFLDARPSRSGPRGADPRTSMNIPKTSDINQLIRHFEAGGAPGGFHRTAYWDYGQWSIGYGTKSRPGEVIDQAEAERRLQSELSSARTSVEAAAKSAGYNFAPHEIDALTSFQYNTGRIRQLLKGGSRTTTEIADAMLLYKNAGGKELRGLVARREAERSFFLNGHV